MADDFRKILWIKSVTRDDDVLAYSGEDETSRAPEPRVFGDLFELHASEDDADTLDAPSMGDLIALTQHDQVTHLVEVAGEKVVPRPRKTIRRGTNDAHFGFQRTCRLIILRTFEDAPLIEDAFGFDPDAKGGEVFEIATLPAFEKTGLVLWAVQRRVERAMRGDLISTIRKRASRSRSRRAR